MSAHISPHRRHPMTFTPGTTYKTRSGEDALIYCTDAPGAKRIHGRVGGTVVSWTADGKAIDREFNHSLDLIPPEPERVSETMWVNVAAWGGTMAFHSKASAEQAAANHVVARIAVPCALTEIVP